MNFSLYVDPGELKKNSKFRKCKGIKGMENLILLPGLEERTGADIMISPPGLPNPANEFLLKMHLDQGALLVQFKFSFDLIASIIDGRLKHSQAKMLATGAASNQIILLSIGLIFEPTEENVELMINGQFTRNIVPAAKNFKWKHYLKQHIKWIHRGGIFENIIFEDNLKVWIESAAEQLEMEPVKQVWQPKQRLFLVDDWRNLLVNLPGLGETKANDIYNWLEKESHFSTSFYSFIAALDSGELVNVPGIGTGTIQKIKDYLKGK